jgi:general secretion pathway protein H
MVLTVAAAAAVKTPIFLGKRPISVRRASGFTLIEITLVMVIAGLLFAIALPNMGALSDSLAYRGAVREVISAAQGARRQSARTGQPVDLVIYPERKAIGVRGDQSGLATLPDVVSLTVTTAAEVSPEVGAAAIRFYPFGGSTGGDIEIAGPGGARTLVQVGWLMGDVTQTVQR